MLQDKMEGGKAEWKNERSLSSLLKHSCFLCWSSPGEAEPNAARASIRTSIRTSAASQQDGRVVTRAAEIRVRRPQHLALVCVRVSRL